VAVDGAQRREAAANKSARAPFGGELVDQRADVLDGQLIRLVPTEGGKHVFLKLALVPVNRGRLALAQHAPLPGKEALGHRPNGERAVSNLDSTRLDADDETTVVGYRFGLGVVVRMRHSPHPPRLP
jgi:hypothetical protein